MKTCTTCRRSLPETEYNWRAKAQGLRHSRCKDCTRASSRNSLAKSPATASGKIKHFIRAKRGKVPNFALTAEWLAARLEALAWCCPCCGQRMNINVSSGNGYAGPRDDSVSVDQLVPGGGYGEENARVLCQRCNTIKGHAKSPHELRHVADWFERELVTAPIRALSQPNNERSKR